MLSPVPNDAVGICFSGVSHYSWWHGVVKHNDSCVYNRFGTFRTCTKKFLETDGSLCLQEEGKRSAYMCRYIRRYPGVSHFPCLLPIV